MRKDWAWMSVEDEETELQKKKTDRKESGNERQKKRYTERQAYKQRQSIGLYKRNVKHKAREKWKDRHKGNDEHKDILFGKEREREIQTNRMRQTERHSDLQ